MTDAAYMAAFLESMKENATQLTTLLMKYESQIVMIGGKEVEHMSVSEKMRTASALAAILRKGNSTVAGDTGTGATIQFCNPVNLQHIRAVLMQIDLSSQSLRTMLQNAIDQGIEAGGTVDVSPMSVDQLVALAVHMLATNAI